MLAFTNSYIWTFFSFFLFFFDYSFLDFLLFLSVLETEESFTFFCFSWDYFLRAFLTVFGVSSRTYVSLTSVYFLTFLFFFIFLFYEWEEFFLLLFLLLCTFWCNSGSLSDPDDSNKLATSFYIFYLVMLYKYWTENIHLKRD